MPILAFIVALTALVAWDPAGLYHAPKYVPPTPTENLQNRWWAAQFSAGLAADSATEHKFLQEQRKLITQECEDLNINPKEVFGNVSPL